MSRRRTKVLHEDGKCTTYYGFDTDFSDLGPEHVVVVTIDGEPAVYALDDPKTSGPLLSYLADHAGGQCCILGVYSR